MMAGSDDDVKAEVMRYRDIDFLLYRSISFYNSSYYILL